MAESRTKRMLLNSMGSAIYQIVNAICGMIIPRFMLVAYGSEINGLVSSISQFLSSLAVVEAGLALVAQQSMYKPIAEKNYNRLSSIVSATRISYNNTGLLFTSLTVILAFLYPYFTDARQLKYVEVVILVFVLSMNYVLSFFIISKYQALFQADQRVYVISISKAIARALNALLVVLMAIKGINIVFMKTIALISVFVQTFIIWIYARKRYSHIDYYATPDNSALKQRGDAMFSQLLGSVTMSGPAIILTIVSDLEQVSVYSVYNMVFVALMGILGIFTNGINASFGSLLQLENEDKVKDTYYEFENLYYLIISIVYLIAMLMITPFVKIYTSDISDTNYLLPGLGILFTVQAMAYNLKTPQGMMVQAAGMFRETRIQNIIQASILMLGGLFFGYFWGIYGVLIAAIMSNIYRCIDLAVFIPHNVLRTSAKKTVKRMIMFSVITLLAYVPLNTIINMISINNLFQWLIVACIVIIYAVLVFFVFDWFFERKYCVKTLHRIKTLFMKG